MGARKISRTWTLAFAGTVLLAATAYGGIRGTSQVTVSTNSFSGAANAHPGRVATPSVPKAPKGSQTITESTTQNIVAGNSVACNNGVSHTDNSYLRAFDLASFGITTDFDITDVSIGIEQSTSGSGTQPATMNLYTWNPADPFTFANFTLIGTADTTVSDQNLTIIDVPVTGTAPAGSTLVVEFFTPDGSAGGNLLFVGSNADGQTAPTYLAAAPCGVPDPTDVAALGFPGMMLVMNVTGTIPTSGALCSSPGLAIPDNDPNGASDTMIVSGTTGAILDLNTSLQLTHTWVGDVTITLTHDDTGTSATYFNRPGYTGSGFGCSGDDADVTADDQGPDTPIETQCANLPAISGDAVGGDPPDATMLAAFNGEDLSGSWTLFATDSAGGDTGTVDTWCIDAVIDTMPFIDGFESGDTSHWSVTQP
jgi:hypothetical protein